MADDRHCPDHDRLTELITRFDEFRVANDQRMEKLNDLRNEVVEDRSVNVRSDVFEVRHGEAMSAIGSNLARLEKVEAWQNRMIGINAVIGIVAGVAGGVVGTIVGAIMEFVLKK